MTTSKSFRSRTKIDFRKKTLMSKWWWQSAVRIERCKRDSTRFTMGRGSHHCPKTCFLARSNTILERHAPLTKRLRRAALMQRTRDCSKPSSIPSLRLSLFTRSCKSIARTRLSSRSCASGEARLTLQRRSCHGNSVSCKAYRVGA